MTRLGVVVLLSALGLLTVSLEETAFAEALSGAYLGGNFGRAQNTYDTAFMDDQIKGAAAASGDTVVFTNSSVQKMSDAWWIDAGYLFTPFFGIDAAFFHLGEIKYVATGTVTTSSGNQPITTPNEVTSHGPALSLILRLPLTESFAANLHVGDYLGKATWENTLSSSSKSSTAAQSNTGSSLLAGVGASYTAWGHWSFRLDYLRANHTGSNNTVGTFSVNLATAGVSYTF